MSFLRSEWQIAARAADLKIDLEIKQECKEYRRLASECAAAEKRDPNSDETLSLRKQIGERGTVLMRKLSVLTEHELELLSLLGPPIETLQPAIGESPTSFRHYYYGRYPGEYISFHFENGKLKSYGEVRVLTGR